MHQTEIASGSKISEFADYASAFSDIFDFDYQVIYYDGTVAEDYQPAWEKFQQVVADFQESINSCYDQESDAALNTFNTMVSNMAGEIEEYTALLPEKINTVTIGEKLTSDGFAELTLDEISFESRIDPPDTSGAYTYYEVQDSNDTYLAIQLTFKNLQSSSGYTLSDFMSITATFTGRYSYSGWSLGVDGGRLTAYPDLIPLKEFEGWYLIEIPKSLKNTAYELSLTFNDTTYVVEQ